MTTAQTKAVGFELDDLTNLNPSKITHRVGVVFDEEGEATVGFIIVGRNSEEHRNVEGRQRLANIQRSAKRGKGIDAKTEEGAAVIAQTVDTNEQERALAVTVDWFGFNVEGAPATFDRNKVETLFKKFPTWQDAVIAALDNDKNFMKV